VEITITAFGISLWGNVANLEKGAKRKRLTGSLLIFFGFMVVANCTAAAAGALI
jgi:hypothetical protein